MRTYEARLDGGDSGVETIEARNLASAWKKAVAWARQGTRFADCPPGTTDPHLLVVGPDGERGGRVEVRS